ncbi:hypothetical protein HDV01_000779 [Terramyces sp. JEL0728]|nr:hypothetical protein HDV01_000779 [Terramyces sp. JEL0728]
MSFASLAVEKLRYLAQHKSIFLILYLAWFYYKRRLSKFALPGPLPIPIFGTLSYYNFTGPAGELVVVTDPKESKRILTDTAVFGKTDFAGKRMQGLLDYALFLLPTDDLWKKHRKLLQPAFGPTHLRHAANVSQKSTIEIQQKFISQLKDKEALKLDANVMLKCITLDVIGQVAFNYPMKAIQALEESGAGSWEEMDNMVTVPFIYRIAFPSFMYKMLGCDVTTPKVVSAKKQVYDLLNELSTQRLEKIKSNEPVQEGWEMDVLHRLLLSQEKGLLTKEEVYGELVGFFFAGHEYLENTLKEAQRLHPVVSQVFRSPNQDTEILGYPIKKGTRCGVFIRGLHLDEKLYKNPLEFNPDRWNEPIIPGSFMPFSDGPHNCIGQKMALIEAKIIMIGLIQKFEFSLDPNFVYEGIQSITFSLKNPMMITIRERK